MAPGEVEHHQHAGQRADRSGEGVDLLARVDGEAHGDQRLQRAPEGGEIDLGVEPADHASLAQRAQPGQRRRRRDPDALGQALVGDPGICGEQFEHRAVDVVDGRLRMIRHASGLPGFANYEGSRVRPRLSQNLRRLAHVSHNHQTVRDDRHRHRPDAEGLDPRHDRRHAARQAVADRRRPAPAGWSPSSRRSTRAARSRTASRSR